MKATNSVTLSRVANSNSSLGEIKKLWRDYADTLGFFPEGAFEHYAQKGQIIIAVDSSNRLLGYLLYRVTPSRNDASIVHLCVNKDARSQGIASLLVKELLSTTKQLKGIGLKCRRDFEANKIWPKFGFKAMSESVGKSKAGSTLTRWWYDHNHPDLFSIAQDTLADIFQNDVEGEKKINLKDCLRGILSAPRDIECYEALDHTGNSIGLLSYNNQVGGVLKVDLLRANKKHKLSKTLIRYLIGTIIKKAEVDKCYLINISDRYLDPETKIALLEDNFHKTNDGWLKLSIIEHLNPNDLSTKLSAIGMQHESLKNYCVDICSNLDDAIATNDLVNFRNVEALISPGFIKKSSIPCYIVSIKPFWAQHLFDERLASHDLFGARIDLALNREAVYYRSAKNSAGISVPARILWYVSQDNKFPGSGALRAYSRIDDVICDYPKQLFRQFRRLGIYEWGDVIYTANGSINNQIMVIRFSNTSLLKKPYEWNDLQKTLQDAGIKTQLQSPCRIPEELFFLLIA